MDTVNDSLLIADITQDLPMEEEDICIYLTYKSIYHASVWSIRTLGMSIRILLLKSKSASTLAASKLTLDVTQKISNLYTYIYIYIYD